MHGDPEFLAKHALEFDGDVLVQVGIRSVEIIDHGKTAAFGKASLGEKLARLLSRLGSGAFVHRRRLVTRARARRHKAMRRHFAGPGDVLGEVLLVDDEGKRLAHPWIVERLPLHVEAKEIVPEEWCGVKIGALLQFAEESRGRQPFVHHEIGDAGGVKVIGGVGPGGGQHVHAVHADVHGIPVTRILD